MTLKCASCIGPLDDDRFKACSVCRLAWREAARARREGPIFVLRSALEAVRRTSNEAAVRELARRALAATD